LVWLKPRLRQTFRRIVPADDFRLPTFTPEQKRGAREF
jgi:hypothetical protein